MKGQIQISVALGMAVISFIAAPLIAYYSAQSATNSRINEVDTKTQVTQSQVINIEKKLDSIEQKLDKLLFEKTKLK